jgi:L-methionine (R)-S-oxide reductase
MADRTETFRNVLADVDRWLAETPGRSTVLQRLCDRMKAALDGYDWVGFYIADDERPELHLGPFAGAPTDHTRIPFGRGICGQVALSRRPMVVEDVTREENYLSCSVDVRSEIVVPILVRGTFVAQIDIDSHAPANFGPADQAFLEALCARLTPLFP